MKKMGEPERISIAKLIRINRGQVNMRIIRERKKST